MAKTKSTKPVEIEQVHLGLRPYILIEVIEDAQGQPRLTMRAGGGFTDTDNVKQTLVGIVEEWDTLGMGPK